jgi:hypothetical protein
MEQLFLYQQWLHQRLQQYVSSSRPITLRGREIALSPDKYGAALLQAYLGKASLSWVAEQARIPLERLRLWRREPQFLLVMDWSKSVFSKTFQENLFLHDYTLAQYHHITAEVSLLEESLRVTVRVPLYQRFMKLGLGLISRHQNNIKLSKYDLRLFRRLFLFFLALEHHWPSSAQKRLSKDFLPLARDVVWPLLTERNWVLPKLESLQKSTPLPQIRQELEIRLSEVLEPLL